jgi:ABC-type transport system involved in cytochrome bd biosynthesis fused ATPase/permease subunit
MDPKIYESVTDKSLWKRLLSMLVLGFAYGIARFVLFATVILQVLFTLFTGSNNEPLKVTGKNLTDYIYDILMFLTFNSEDRPFPFRGWSEQGAH